MCVKRAETFRADLWPLQPPHVWFTIPLVWPWGWGRRRGPDRVLLSKSGLFKQLKGVQSCLDRSQRQCWCKPCKVNLPPPPLTCLFIVFHFTSCNVPDLVHVASWKYLWLSFHKAGKIYHLLALPCQMPHVQFLRSFTTKFRNWISFKTRCPQIPASFMFTTPYMTPKLVPEVWLGHPLNFPSLRPRQL